MVYVCLCLVVALYDMNECLCVRMCVHKKPIISESQNFGQVDILDIMSEIIFPKFKFHIFLSEIRISVTVFAL